MRHELEYVKGAITELKITQGFVKLNRGFLADKYKLVRDEVVPYQWKALNDEIPGAEPSHAIENFRIAAGEVEGGFAGRIFQDSDVAKWLEAASYLLADERDAELEKLTDEVIDLIARVQMEDGYLNTYFQVAEPDKKWTNVRDWHEMYCAGHLIEAAVAYYQATGKRKILEVACRLADHIDSRFGPDEGKVRGYPGHQEIELALVKLYKVTGEKRYLDLSKFFVTERGRQPHFFELEGEARGAEERRYFEKSYLLKYNQSHVPIEEQKVAIGHAVRAMYYYSAATDLAVETGDEVLEKAVRDLWHNVTRRQMYITGGVGAQSYGESFSVDYDLPNDRAYTETCAAIGLVFWAKRMLELELNRDYGDVMERALYNGVLSGMSLDGSKYFYVNPLEVWPDVRENRGDHRHVKGERQKWFGCACCPPNIARLLASIRNYIYSSNEKGIFTHLYTENDASFNVAGTEVLVRQNTDYPWDGEVTVTIEPEAPVEFAFGLRIPAWCKSPQLKVNGETVDLSHVVKDGYAVLERKWKAGDSIELTLPMPVEKIAAHPAVRANLGKVAIQRGPIVYCLEEVDNGKGLTQIVLLSDAELKAEFREDLLGGVVVVRGKALKLSSKWNDDLYQPAQNDQYDEMDILAVPYYAWANRAPGEMVVWVKSTSC